MRMLGIEISGNDANIALVEYQNDMFYMPECRVRKVNCRNPDNNSDLKYFQKSIRKLVEDYKIDGIVIKERMKKGKFAGGANGFKLEAVMQLIENCDVQLMQTTTLNAILKKYPILFNFSETGLKKFQESAFKTAFAALSDPDGKAEQLRQRKIAQRKENREAQQAEFDDYDYDDED